MGQSCRACQTNSQEIKSDPCDLRGPLKDKVQDRMTSSVRQVKEILVAPNDVQGLTSVSTNNKENEGDFSFADHMGPNTKKEGLIMSTGKINGHKKDSLPDYLNEITRKKLAELPPF